jgi:HSP20 family molecular chaperone IbpA
VPQIFHKQKHYADNYRKEKPLAFRCMNNNNQPAGGHMNDERLPEPINIRYEPPVRQIIDEGNYFQIIAEMPGINEEKIRISLENNILTLKWRDSANKHQEEEICFPCRMKLSKKKFQDGILEISLEKIQN